MKYFLDTEFLENGKIIDPISIAIVSEDDRELYLCNDEFKFNPLDSDHAWIKKNVIPFLPKRFNDVDMNAGSLYPWLNKNSIKDKIEEYFESDDNPEIWAYYADYDWVLFCQIFGTMIDLPEKFPKFCMDLKQWMAQVNFPDELKPIQENEHDALEDAKWNKRLYFEICKYLKK